MPWPKEPRRATPRGSWSKLGRFFRVKWLSDYKLGALLSGWWLQYLFFSGGEVAFFSFPPGTDEVGAKWFPHIAAIHSDPEVRGMNPWLVFDMDWVLNHFFFVEEVPRFIEGPWNFKGVQCTLGNFYGESREVGCFWVVFEVSDLLPKPKRWVTVI